MYIVYTNTKHKHETQHNQQVKVLLEQHATSVAKRRIANISQFTDETDTTLLLYRQHCWQVSNAKTQTHNSPICLTSWGINNFPIISNFQRRKIILLNKFNCCIKFILSFIQRGLVNRLVYIPSILPVI